MTSIESLLKTVPLFRTLGEERLGQLAGIGRVQSLGGREVVFAKGDRSLDLYVILTGKVRVFDRDADGNEVEFSVLSPGDFFGDLALLTDKPRSATVACTEPSTFLILDKEAFLTALTWSTSFLHEFLTVMCNRQRTSSENLFAKALAKERLQAEMELERHRSLSQMVAGVAHEINTPLGIANTAASMIAERLQEGADALARGEASAELVEDVQEAVKLILGNLGRASRLINTFKNLSVHQAAGRKEQVNLSVFVAEVVGLFTLNARRARIEIEVLDRLTDQARTWYGDPGPLSQVILNLLTNVERYAYPDRQGGKLEVVLGYAPGKEWRFRLSVQDFGRGIPAENLTRIFEPFFTTGREKGGSGLGLAIVHNIVTSLMGGTVECQSQPGQGTTFILTFPAGTMPASGEEGS